jgi:hypothetical protein
VSGYRDRPHLLASPIVAGTHVELRPNPVAASARGYDVAKMTLNSADLANALLAFVDVLAVLPVEQTFGGRYGKHRWFLR